MSTKTTFKRIALVAVAALGLGVLSVAPSQSAVMDETLTLSAASATVAIGETASVTITNAFTNTVASETSSITVTGAGATAGLNIGAVGAAIAVLTSDSINVTFTPAKLVESAVITSRTSSADTYVAFPNRDSLTATSSTQIGTLTKVTYRLDVRGVTTAGTHTYNIYTSGDAGTIRKSATFTVTVTAAVSTSSATYSKTWLNRAAEYSSMTGALGLDAFNTVAGAVGVESLKSDSTLIVSAGTVTTPVKVAILWGELRSANDTKVVSVLNQTRITDSITVTISGPGLLSTVGRTVFGLASETAKAKQITMDSADSLIVYSDGTVGSSTITSYKGTSVLAANVLASPKTITFTGRATTFTTTVSTKIVSGSNLGFGGQSTAVSTGTNDSATAGTSIITFVAKDSAGNAVTDAGLSVLPGMTSGAFYAVSSDTKVVRATNSATSQFLTCSYVTSKWVCSGNVVDSGTVTLTIQDSTTGTAPYSATAVSLTVAGSGYTGTIALDKTTYNVGEKALITLTSKDSAGRTVGNGASSPFGNVAWGSTAPTFGDDSSANSAGGALTSGSLTNYLTAGGTFISGTDTVMVFMPTIAGTYTLNGTTGSSTTVGSILTFTVVDPAATAAAAASAAAKDAADAATDAALEATDAAYAATDAANIAAEAADAATAAAEAATEAANAAKESADAATAAVEELATSVAKLMAALQAQITTLAKVVAKIAVKVKA